MFFVIFSCRFFTYFVQNERQQGADDAGVPGPDRGALVRRDGGGGYGVHNGRGHAPPRHRPGTSEKKLMKLIFGEFLIKFGGVSPAVFMSFLIKRFENPDKPSTDIPLTPKCPKTGRHGRPVQL